MTLKQLKLFSDCPLKKLELRQINEQQKWEDHHNHLGDKTLFADLFASFGKLGELTVVGLDDNVEFRGDWLAEAISKLQESCPGLKVNVNKVVWGEDDKLVSETLVYKDQGY